MKTQQFRFMVIGLLFLGMAETWEGWMAVGVLLLAFVYFGFSIAYAFTREG